MLVFVKEYCRDVNVRIYGSDGEERTHEFFEKYFLEKDSVYETKDEEREQFHTKAAFTIVYAAYYEFLALHIENIQRALDDVTNGKFDNIPKEEYVIDNVFYTI